MVRARVALPRVLRERPVPAALVVVTALAVAVRLVELGARPFYFDETWFGYWVLQFLEHGDWTYRPVLHGPFYARVNAVVFTLVGANDYTARLVPALLGGLLPLAAWLFRERLRGAEVVALAVLLAANPILLYYSRFMRKDLPLAAFMLVALGLLVRASDTGRPRYLYGAAVALGWAATTKESVLLWLLAWGGAAGLVLDRRLLEARHDGGPATVLGALGGRLRRGAGHWGGHLVGAAAAGLAVVVYAYAPRAGEVRTVGLWRALGGEVGQLPAVLEAATVGAFGRAVDYWVAGDIQSHPYLPYLADTLATLATGAPAVCLLAVVGVLWDRYARVEARSLVGFNFHVGVAAVLGYPLANNLPVPWSTVHAVVPLAVPAAVGGVVVIRWGLAGLAAARGPGRDLAAVGRTAAVALAVGALAVNAAAVGAQTSYLAPTESPRGGDGGSEVVYYAQPPAEIRGSVAAIARAAATGGDDLDVLYVGAPLTDPTPPVAELPADTPYDERYPLVLSRVPFPWYTELFDADVADVGSAAGIDGPPPPVVVTTPGRRGAVADRLGPAYEATRQPLDDIGDRTVVVFVRTPGETARTVTAPDRRTGSSPGVAARSATA